jgi:hypothetical protein
MSPQITTAIASTTTAHARRTRPNDERGLTGDGTGARATTSAWSAWHAGQRSRSPMIGVAQSTHDEVLTVMLTETAP